ncbi:MAG: hypothetical protein QW273_01775 [Candidatus Pacearchaeota archaeon]
MEHALEFKEYSLALGINYYLGKKDKYASRMLLEDSRNFLSYVNFKIVDTKKLLEFYKLPCKKVIKDALLLRLKSISNREEISERSSEYNSAVNEFLIDLAKEYLNKDEMKDILLEEVFKK